MQLHCLHLTVALNIGTIQCLIYIFIEMTWAVVLLFLIGKLGITSSFGIVFVHTAEMLPTTVRSGGVGFSSTTARFGALLAPFVPLLVCVKIVLFFRTVYKPNT